VNTFTSHDVNLHPIDIELYLMNQRSPLGGLSIIVASAGSMKPGKVALVPSVVAGVRALSIRQGGG
jgi:hypothetical protein